MTESLPTQNYVTISQAAKILGVSIDTLRRWDKKGELKSVRLDGKNRYYLKSDLKSFKKSKPLSISEAASALSVSVSTLRRLEERGVIIPDRSVHGERLYDPTRVKEILEKRKKERKKTGFDLYTPTTVAKPVFHTPQVSVSIAKPIIAHEEIIEGKQEVIVSAPELEDSKSFWKKYPFLTYLGHKNGKPHPIASEFPHKNQKVDIKGYRNALITLGIVIFLTSSIFAYGIFKSARPNQTDVLSQKADSSSKTLAVIDKKGDVLAVTAGEPVLTINIQTLFNEDVTLNNKNLDIGTGELTASNVIYSITAGDGITITPGQNPIISADGAGVESLGGATGVITLGSNLSISNNVLSASSTSVNAFSTIDVGGTDIDAGTADTLTFSAGSGITLSADTSNKKITIAASSATSNWTLSGTSLYPDSTSYNVGIGNSSPTAKLDVTGNFVVSGTTSFNGVAYTWPGADGSNTYILQTNGSGTLSWIDPGTLPSSNSFTISSGAIYPNNPTLDFLVGGSSSASAKFGFINVNSGTPAIQINGTTVLTPTTLGVNVSSSSLTSVGTLSSGAINTGFGIINTGNTITTTDTITGATVNSTGSIQTGGTDRISSGGNLQNIGTTQFNTITYTWPSGGQSAGYALVTDGSGTLSWSGTGGFGTNYWTLANALIFPTNVSVDFAIGGSASTSAKFAVLNVNSGTPTASLSAGAAGGAYLTADGTLQTTANQALTIGGSTTGNITLSPLNGSGTVTSTGDLNLSSGKAFTINSTSVLNATTLGSAVVSSSLTTVGALTSGSIASGFGTIATANTITGTTLNGTTGINTGAGAGTNRIDSNGALSNITTISSTYFTTGASYLNLASGTSLQINSTAVIDSSRNLTNIGTTQFNTVTYTWPASDAASSNYVLVSNGAGTLSWLEPGQLPSVNYWDLGTGTISPKNSTVDLLLGASATTSAKFAFLNVAGGTPTASISANSSNYATYITGLGNIGTTSMQNLTLGGSTTGTITISPRNGSGTIVLDGTTTLNGVAYTWPGADAGASGYALTSNGAGTLSWTDTSGFGTNYFTIANGSIYPYNPTLDFIIGAYASTSAKFAVLNVNSGTPTASLSAGSAGGLYITANGTITTTNGQNLTIGGNSTGDITVDSGTVGNVNLGTGNNAKTINLGTGTAGNTINIATNNTTADTVNIGSALDTVNITGATNITLGSSNLNITGLANGTGDAICVNGSYNLVTCTAGTGGISGTGKASRIAFYSDPSTITYNNNFYWDNTNTRLGVGTASPTSTLDVASGSYPTTISSTYKGIADTSTAFASVDFKSGIAGTWVTSYNTTETEVYAFAIDSTNSIVYAGTSANGIIYRCDLSTGCDTSGEWTTSYDTTESTIWALEFDSENGILYAGTGTNGLILRCDTTTSCDASGDWTTAYDTSDSAIKSFGIDTVNDVLYVGTQVSGSNGHIMRCALSTGCDASGDFSTVYTHASTYWFGAFAFDATNEILYAGAGNNSNGEIFRCDTTSACDDSGDFSSVYTDSRPVNMFAIDTANQVLYAAIGNTSGGLLKRCPISTDCNASGDFASAYSGINAYTVGYNPVNSSIYVSVTAGDLAVCATSSACNASGDFSVSLATGEDYIVGLGINTDTGQVFAGSTNGGIIYTLPSVSFLSFAQIQAIAADSTSGSEDGTFLLKQYVAGASTEALRVQAGSLGLGTTNPGRKLEINDVSGNNLRLTYNDSDGSATNYTDFTTGADGALTINSTGTITLSDNVIFGGTTTLNGVAYTWPAADAGASGYALTSNGAGTLSWTDVTTLASNYFSIGSGLLYPTNTTLDFAVGGTASSSAKFAVLNVAGGTPTASLSAGAAGGAYLTADGTLQTTANQTLTIGGSTTGNITLSPLNGSGTVTSTGDINLSSGKAYYINGTSVLNASTLGTGVTTSSLTTVGALTSGSIASGFGTIATANTITGTTLNGTTGINTGAGAGTSRIDSSGNLANIGTTQFNTVTYTWPGSDAGASGYALTSNGAGTLSWTDTAGFGTNYWTIASGALYPYNPSLDLLIGGTSTASADFAVLNVNGSSYATASVSGNLIVMPNTGLGGKVGIGTTSPTSELQINDTNGDSEAVINLGSTTGRIQLNGNNVLGANSVATAFSVNGSEKGRFTTTGLGVATTAPGKALEINSATGANLRLTYNDSDGSATNYTDFTTGSDGALTINSTGTITLSDNVIFGGTTTLNGVAYTWPAADAGASGYALTSNGAGTLSWTDTSGFGTNYWTLASGSLYPYNPTLDLFIGAYSSASAKFGFINVNSGTPAIQISGSTVLTGTTLGSGVTTSSLTTVGALASGSIATGFGTISTSNTITGTTLNGTTGINTGASAGTQRIDSSGNLVNIGTTQFNSLTYTWPGSHGSSGYALTNNGAGTLSWTDTSGFGTNYFTIASGAIYPSNTTLDFLVGGTGTTSADFAVLNVDGSGPVTATVSGNLMVFPNTGVGGRIGIGTTNVSADYITILPAGGGGIALREADNGNLAVRLSSNNTEGYISLYRGGSRVMYFSGSSAEDSYINNARSLGINTTTPGKALDINSATGDNLRLTYNDSNGSATNYADFTTGSDGSLTINSTGTTTLSDAVTFGSTTTFNSLTYTWPGSQTAGYILQTNGSGTLSWVDPAGTTGYWTQSSSGLLYPNNSTVDFAIGGTATTSAKFAVINVLTGTPTATLSAGAAGGAYLTATGTLTTTASQPITIGGATAGDITLSPIGGSGRVTSTGDLSLSTGKAYLINGTSVLSATTLGTGVTTSSLTSVGALASGSIATGFGTISTSNTITGTTLNGTTGINTGASAGTQRIDSSGNLVNIGTTQFNSLTYTWPASHGSSGYILSNNGAGTLSWIDATGGGVGTNYFSLGTGTIYPTNVSLDLLLGASASSSAKFAFINVNSGTPTASISANANNYATYISGDGIIGRTNMGDLTLGSATTGDIIASPRNGSGTFRVNGTTTLNSLTYTWPASHGSSGYILSNNGAGTLSWIDATGGGVGTNYWSLGTGTIYPTNTSLDFLLGASATTSAKFAVLNVAGGTPTASLSAGAAGGAYLTAAGTLQTTANQTLTLGGSTTNGITLAENTAISGTLDVSGNGAFGNGGSVSTTSVLTINDSITDTGSTLYRGIFSRPTIAASSDSGVSIRGVDASPYYTGSVNLSGYMAGLLASPLLSSSAGTLATSYGVYSYPFYGSTTTTAVTNAYAFYAQNATLGGATVTNQYGLLVTDQTSGTNDYGIAIAGADTQALWVGSGANNTDAENGIAFGSSRDTNLYRSAANVLKTDDSLNVGAALTVGSTTTLNGVTYTWPAADAGASGYALTSNGAGTLSWTDTAGFGTNYFSLGTGTIYPTNTSLDLLLGASGTTSAKFAFTGVSGGTPTASISANSNSYATYITGLGNLAATSMQGLTLGGSTTGDITLSPRGGSGTTIFNGTTTLNGVAYTWPGSQGSNYILQTDGAGTLSWVPPSGGGIGTNYFSLGTGTIYPTNTSLDFLLGASATTSAKFAVLNVAGGTPTASLSAGAAGGAYLTATGTLQTTAGQTLTLGGTTTGQINIGTDATARNIRLGNSTGASSLAFTSGTGSQTFTSNVATGTTTTSGFVFDATAINSGTGAYFTSDSVTTGKLVNIAPTGNTLTSGTLLNLSSTATSLTGTAGIGSLINLDWSPGSATTATGDLFALNIGTYGTTTGNLFNILDTSSSLFSISETAVTSNLPVSFNSPGDVSIAYDLVFTNPTASYITSSAPLTIQAGETFNSSNLTLGTYNVGNVIVDSQAFVTNYAATVSGQLVVGTATAPGNTSGFYVTNPSTYGKALAILNQTESQDLLTASASGTWKFQVKNDGTTNLASGATYQIAGTNVLSSSTLGTGVTTSSLTTVGALASGSIASGFGTIATANTITGTTINGTTGINTGAAAGTQRIDSSGNLTNIGTTQFNTITYTWPGSDAGASGYALTSNGAGTLSWTDTAGFGTNYFSIGSGLLYPTNTTLDFLLGASASTSAKFAVLNVNSGTPTASLSAGSAGGTYLTATGTLQTTAGQTLTLGGTTTGQINLGTDATARNVTIGNNTGASSLSFTSGTGAQTFTSSNASGTTTSSAFSLAANSVTTGNGLYLSATGLTSGTVFDVVGTSTNTGSSEIDFSKITYTAAPASSSSDGFTGLRVNTTTAAGSNIANNITGLAGYATNTSTAGTVNYARGVLGQIYSSGSGGTLATGVALYAANPSVTAGTITSNYGLLIEDQTAGTSDYGLAISGADTQLLWLSSAADNTDAANGIAFGSSRDTNLYRSAANVLKTDDSLNVGVALTVGTTTTLNAVTYTWPAADAGASGYALTSNGAGTLSWTDTSTFGASYFSIGTGTIYPTNTTLDFLLGASASSSAKFAFLGVASDTPIASISASSGSGLYLSYDGSIQTTINGALTLGGSTTNGITIAEDVTTSTGVINSSVASGGTAFSFDADNSFTSGNLFSITENNGGTQHLTIDDAGNLNLNGTSTTAGNGNTIYGDTDASAHLYLVSTSNGTKGNVYFQSTSNYINVNNDFTLGGDATFTGNNVGIGTSANSTANLRFNSTSNIDVFSNVTAPTLTIENRGVGGNASVSIEGALTVGSTTTLNAVTYTWPAADAGASGYALTSNGAGTLSWTSISGGTSYFTAGSGLLYPTNATLDFAIGGTATTSAKFAILGVNDNAPVASLSGSTGGAYLTATGTLQTTANQALTIGGSTTGNITLSPLAGSGTVSVSGAVSATSTITGTTLNGTTGINTGAGAGTSRIDSSGNLANIGTISSTYLTSGASYVNLTSGTELQVNGTAVIDSSRNLANIGTTGINGVVYTWPASATAGYILQSGSTGATSTLTWVDPGTLPGVWSLASGTTYLSNTTLDMLVGGTASSSAKFAILGVAADTPVASISASSGSGLYLSYDGSIQTTKNAALTLGGATTGNIILSPFNNSGTVSIGTTSIISGAELQLSATAVDQYFLTGNAQNTNLHFYENGSASMVLNYDGSGAGDANQIEFQDEAANPLLVIERGGHIGIGVDGPTAWLDIVAATTSEAQINLTSSAGTNPSAPVSGDLWWNGTNLYFYNGGSNIDILGSGSISGSGTANRLARWTDASTIATSNFFDDATNIAATASAGTSGSSGTGGGTVNVIAGNGGDASTGNAGNGGAISLTTGSGGKNSSTTNSNGASGGAFTITLGAGGSGQYSSSAGFAGNGGAFTVTAGAGGQSENQTAGTGGGLTFTAGAGGAGVGGSGGAAGAFSFTSGAGGNSSSGNAGNGGNFTITLGAGGSNSASSNTNGGAGGSFSLTLGTGGVGYFSSSGGYGGAGGGFTVVAGNGGASGTSNVGGAGGGFTFNAGAGGINSGAGGAFSFTSGKGGNGGAAVGNGGNFTITLGAGGSNSSTTNTNGGAGGSFSLTLGAGGTGYFSSSYGAGGAGGGFTVVAGNGGASGTSGAGGNGGGFTFNAGAGGGNSGDGGAFSFTSGTGANGISLSGAGGDFTVTLGSGGSNSSINNTNGGNGGGVTFTLGHGGRGYYTSSYGAGGAGGSFIVTAGNGGVNGSSGTPGVPGSIQLTAGSGTTTGGNISIQSGNGTADGTIDIGTNNSSAITIGMSGMTTSIGGNISVASFSTANTAGLCWDNSGASLIYDCNGAPTDLAEYFGATDSSVEAGDIVVADGNAVEVIVNGAPTSKAYVKKASASYQGDLLGVISTAPNQVYGDDGLFDGSENPRPVSLAGRVPVKVNTQNGPINRGDVITSSSTPGVGMKATKAGRVLGVALSSYNGSGTGKVVMYVNPQYYLGDKLYADTTSGFLDANGVLKTEFDGKVITADKIDQLIDEKVASGFSGIVPEINVQGIASLGVEGASQGSLKISSADSGSVLITSASSSANWTMTLPVDSGINGEVLVTDGLGNTSWVAPDVITSGLRSEVFGVLGTATDSAQTTTIFGRLAKIETEDLTDVNTKLSIFSLVTDPFGAISKAVFNVQIAFNNGVEFLQDIVLAGRIKHTDQDTAGIAVIKAGTTEVEITFDRPYEVAPIVNITANNSAASGFVKNATESGFTVAVPATPSADVQFTWSAVLIENPRISESGVTPTLTPAPTATPSPTLTPTPTP